MHPRVRLAILTAATLGLIAILTVAVTTHGSDEPLERGLQGAVSPSGQPAAAFALSDQNGQRLRMSSLRGRPVILTFLYTTCTDTCPTTAQQIRGALDQVGEDVPALAVSVDPKNDTADRAKRFVSRQQLTGRLRFLVGSRAELAPVWREYGIQPQEKGRDHSARVVLLDKSGRPAVAWPVEQLTPEGLAHDLRILLAARG